MIELTTGAIFLMSSLYGNATPDNGAMNAPVATPTEVTTTATSSTTTSTAAMQAYLRKEFADTPILVDIARCESNFHQFDKDGNIVRGRVNKADIGVMQINEKYHADEAVKLGYNIYTVEGNVAFAKYLYDKYGSDPWSSSSKCWSDAELARL